MQKRPVGAYPAKLDAFFCLVDKRAFPSIFGHLIMIPLGRKSCFLACFVAVDFFLSQASAPAQVVVKIGQNIVGRTYGSNSSAIPPDPNGAVGPQHFVELINGNFDVYKKTNGVNVRRTSDSIFWGIAGLNISSSVALSDPRIIFDPLSQRWFASEVDLDANADDPTLESNDYLLGVSATSDPTGAWHAFLFPSDPDTGDFADFPTLGVDSSGVYLSGDMFYGMDNPVGPGLVSIPKADLLAASPTVNNRTWFGVMDYSVRGEVLQPVTCFDGTSSGNILAMGDIGFDSNPHSNLVASTVINAGTASASLSDPTNIFVTPYVVPYNAEENAPFFTPIQPDFTTQLAANDERLCGKVYCVGGVLTAVHSTELNGRIAICWYRINAANQRLIESGVISNTNLDLFFPSVAANSNGTTVITCNGCSINTYVSCFAIAGQTVNGVTTFGPPTLLKAGVTSYHGDDELLAEFLGGPVISRWGDYTAISVDPTNPGRFWTVGMYPSDVVNNDVWSTQITELITAPLQLTVAQSGTNLMVSWPVLASDYQLQSTANLTPPIAWSNVPQATQTNSTQAYVLVPNFSARQYFRLFH